MTKSLLGRFVIATRMLAEDSFSTGLIRMGPGSVSLRMIVAVKRVPSLASEEAELGVMIRSMIDPGKTVAVTE